MRSVINIGEVFEDERLSGHLRMGGVNPAGEDIQANSMYLTRSGRPWLPVMGEFHFTRYPERYWEEELLKMKAGGIQIVATYVFWIHHEEIEGRFDWSGNKDLRHFVQLCGQLGLETCVRIGPWAHGECRNGGFPDWIYGKCALRTNDEHYLSYVRKLYAEIARQLQGLAYQDGGPVVAIQLDNELTDNAEHLRMLKGIALEMGIRAPLYTVTGWGGPGGAKIPIDEVLPLFGGYPDHPWEKHTKPLEPGPHYFFHSVRNDPGIGSDLLGTDHRVVGDLANMERYPNGTCELGCGVQMTYHRRPIIEANDVGAMAMIRIANGCNLLGYYMYHGGSNPLGKLSTMQESNLNGNQLPIFSYDFQAPIGEFGFIRDSYSLLKRLHLFIRDFGEQLAPMATVFPEVRPSSLIDHDTLRIATRSKNGSGFVFCSNYQRLAEMQRKENVLIELRLPGEQLLIPEAPFTLEKDAYFFWPFNMPMEGILLKYATAQPLCTLRNGNDAVYVFFETGGVKTEYVLDSDAVRDITVSNGRVTREGRTITINELSPGLDCEISLLSATGNTVTLLTICEQQSLHAWKGMAFGQERLILCDANVVFNSDGLQISGQGADRAEFSVYPPVEHELRWYNFRLPDEQHGSFQTFIPQIQRQDIEVTYRTARNSQLDDEHFPFLFEEKGEEGTSPEWEIDVDISALEAAAHDIVLTIDYIGDVAQVYIDGRCVADHFYSGVPWKLGLKRYRDKLTQKSLVLKISPLLKERDMYLQMRPAGSGQAHITSIHAEAEWVLRITKEN